MRTHLGVVSLALASVLAACSDSHTVASPDASVPMDMFTLPSALTQCDVPSVCALRSQSCCGTCGQPTSTDMVAVRTDKLTTYNTLACGSGTACPACAGMPDPYLLATCSGGGTPTGHCVAHDLRAEPITECTVDSDCILGPLTCCACGVLTEPEIVSYNLAGGSLRTLVCDPDVTCPPCVPSFGVLLARCEAGRCVVRYPTR